MELNALLDQDATTERLGEWLREHASEVLAFLRTEGDFVLIPEISLADLPRYLAQNPQ